MNLSDYDRIAAMVVDKELRSMWNDGKVSTLLETFWMGN